MIEKYIRINIYFLMILFSINYVNAETKKIAILSIKNMQSQPITELSFLADLIRSTASRLPTADYSIITQENIIALLPEGKTLEDCQSQSTCEVTMGRELGADYIITSEITTYGDEYRISMRLHQTKTAQLIATGIIPAKKITDFEKPLQAETLRLLSKLDPNMAEQAERASQGIIFQKIGIVDTYQSSSVEFSKLSKINLDQNKEEELTLHEIKGIDLSGLDIPLLKAYDFALKQEKSTIAKESDKLNAWQQLLPLTSQQENLKQMALERMKIWKNALGKIAYNATLEFDQESKPNQNINDAQEKISKWKALFFEYPIYQQQSEQRIKEWEAWIKIEKDKDLYFFNSITKMTDLENKRKEKMNQDWSKLSELLILDVLPETEKKKYSIAFIEAYGVVPSLNPYLNELKLFLPSQKTLKDIEKENLLALKQRLDILLKAKPDYQWNANGIALWLTIPLSLIEKLDESIIDKSNIPKSLEWKKQRDVKKNMRLHTDFPILPLFRLIYSYCPSCVVSKDGIGFDYQIGYDFFKSFHHMFSLSIYLDSALFKYFANDKGDRSSIHFYTIPTIKLQKQNDISASKYLYYGIGLGLGYHGYYETVYAQKDYFTTYQSGSFAYKVGIHLGIRPYQKLPQFNYFQISLDLLNDISPNEPDHQSVKNCTSCLYQKSQTHIQLGINFDIIGIFMEMK